MLTALTPSRPAEVFVSYAHKDEKLREQLAKHLASLEHRKIITSWHGRQIIPGDPWEEEIDKHLSSAQIILLLVSANFLASGYCFGVEFKRAMERHQSGSARVIPVILRPCAWRETALGKLQALPKGAKPVVKWTNIDDAFLSVTEGITQAVKELSLIKIKQIVITVEESPGHFSLEDFTGNLRDQVRVDLDRITISIQMGSVKVVIEGDSEELARIVIALRDPTFQRELTRGTTLKSISYIQDQQQHSVRVGESQPPKNNGTSGSTLIEILKEAIRAVPAVRYALGVAGIAAAVAIVAGFSIGYKVAVLGTITMFVLMFGLVSFSWFATHSATGHSAASIRPLALTLAWTFVLLIAATSLCIFTGFFFSWPRPLEDYVHFSSPNPIPTPSPAPTALPSPSPTATTHQIQITLTKVPPYDPVGGPNSKAPIAGKVSGARPGDYSIVIYSLTNMWYVQPTEADPKTDINSDGTWSADIQTGSRYAILVVSQDYRPPNTTTNKPTHLEGVVASIDIEGKR